MPFKNVCSTADGERVVIQDGKLQVPNNPILPFVEEMAPVAISGAPQCGCLMPQFRRLTGQAKSLLDGSLGRRKGLQ